MKKLIHLSGLKRLFSINSIFELVKSLLKISIVGYICYAYLNNQVNDIIQIMDMEVMHASLLVIDIVVTVAFRIAMATSCIGNN